jgi:hypothetical protein
MTACEGHKENLQTIIRAAKEGCLGLVECRVKATGEVVAVLTAFGPEKDGAVAFTPFAVLPNGNPYELLEPPNPEGGFFPEDTP